MAETSGAAPHGPFCGVDGRQCLTGNPACLRAGRCQGAAESAPVAGDVADIINRLKYWEVRSDAKLLGDARSIIESLAAQVERLTKRIEDTTEYGVMAAKFMDLERKLDDAEQRADRLQAQINKCRQVCRPPCDLEYNEVMHRAVEAEKERDRLQADLNAAKVDAERYRWLRSHCQYGFEDHEGPQLIHRNGETGPHQNAGWRKDLDAAIDAARAKESGDA